MDLRLLVAFCALCLPLTAECGGVDRTEGEARPSVQKLNNFLDAVKEIAADPEGFEMLLDKARCQRTKTLHKVLLITLEAADSVLRRDRIARFIDDLPDSDWYAERAVTKLEEALNEQDTALRQGMPQEPTQGAVGGAQPENPSDEGPSASSVDVRYTLQMLDEYIDRRDVWFDRMVMKLSHRSIQRYLTLATTILHSASEMMRHLKEEGAVPEMKAQEALNKARDALNEDLE